MSSPHTPKGEGEREGKGLPPLPCSFRTQRKRLVNTVDVVEHLRDPTDPSTEYMAPPRSAHVQLDEVHRSLDPVKDEGEFCQHGGVVTLMMKLSATGFA